MNAWEPIVAKGTRKAQPFVLRRAAADGRPPPTPLVFASPHSGRDYPDDMMAAAALDAQAIRRSEDAFVDDLISEAPKLGAAVIAARYARAYIDLNREAFELDPSMFEDELPEFARAVLDSLRQPIESGEAMVARANAHVKYPARFQLVAAMNPCRCGYLSEPARGCGRAPKCALDYQARVSGPLLDRIDLHLEVAAVSAADLSLPAAAEGSAEVAARVAAARAIQRERLGPHRLRTNAEAEGEVLETIAMPDDAGRKLLTEAAERMQLSARGYHRVLKVARTIADLAGAEPISSDHISEAIQFRSLNQQLWG